MRKTMRLDVAKSLELEIKNNIKHIKKYLWLNSYFISEAITVDTRNKLAKLMKICDDSHRRKLSVISLRQMEGELNELIRLFSYIRLDEHRKHTPLELIRGIKIYWKFINELNLVNARMSGKWKTW